MVGYARTRGFTITKLSHLNFTGKTLDSFIEQCNPINVPSERRPHGGTRKPVPTRRPVTRRIMNDVADGLLLDVREISITDLEFADSNSALSQALERILMSKPERNYAGFNNFIS
jgi:hypothetical protein